MAMSKRARLGIAKHRLAILKSKPDGGEAGIVRKLERKIRNLKADLGI